MYETFVLKAVTKLRTVTMETVLFRRYSEVINILMTSVLSVKSLVSCKLLVYIFRAFHRLSNVL